MKIFLRCRIYLYALLVTLAVPLTGCATGYPVRFNGYASRPAVFPPSAGFHVKHNQNTGNPLLDREIGNKIGALLTSKGYRLVPEEEADFILIYGYSSTGQSPSDIKPAYSASVGIGSGISRGGSISTQMVFPGSREGLSYTDTMSVQVFESQEYRISNEKKPLWIGESTIETANPDMREMVDFLLPPIFTHFGENTKRSIKAKLSPEDPSVKKLKGEKNG